MKKTVWIACLLCLCASTMLFGERFRWAVEKDVSYRVNTYINEERYINGDSLGVVEIRNKAVLHALAVSNTNAAYYKGEFQYFEREAGLAANADKTFALKEIYPTEFWRDQLGKYYIQPDVFMPVVRDVPLFTPDDITPGAMWRANGHEVHDLKDYGLTRAYHIPFTARYIYVGDRTINKKRIALFSITYIFNHYGDINIANYQQGMIDDLSRYRAGSSEYNRLKELYDLNVSRIQYAPQRVSGSCILLYYWDVAARLPYSVSEDFHFIFTLVNGEVHEFKGVSESTFEIIEQVKEREADAIVRSLQGNAGAGANSGISVHKDERGIVVELGDILFDTDSAQLKPEARARLNELSKRINSSGKFDIRVEGHTDSTGTAEYNMKLSQDRARAVAGFLTGVLNTEPSRISWIGHGMTRPGASNATEAGRAKNRRVEIILLTNE